MILTRLLNRLSRVVFEHRTYRRCALDRWLRARRPLLHGRVLDVGSKRSAGKGLFRMQEGPGDRWFSLDINPAGAPDVLAFAEHLPFPAECFDAIVCSEVLEHVAGPQAMLRELYRALKPGGRLLLSTPFMYPVHGDPYDYQRLTATRLRQLLAPYRRVEIEISGYFPSIMGDVLRRALHGTSRRYAYKYLFYPLLPVVFLLVQCERWAFFRRLYGWEDTISGYMITVMK